MLTRDDRGAIAIVVAVLTIALFGLAAIVVDLGVVRTTRLEAQTAVDAAVLAGVDELYVDGNPAPQVSAAVTEIKRLALANFGTTNADWTACTDSPPAGWATAAGERCIQIESSSPPTKMRVVLPGRETPVAFGGLVGYGGADVGAVGIAQAFDQQIKDCALCVGGFLAVAANGLVRVQGDGSLFADDGSVGSGGMITVGPATGAVIGFRLPPQPVSNPSRYSPDPPIVGVTPQDPLAGTPMPPAVAGPDEGNVTCDGTGDLVAGRVYRNVTVSGPCSVSGGPIRITGQMRFNPVTSTFTGSSTTSLFFTCRPAGAGGGSTPCSSGQSGGDLVMPSGATMTLAGSSSGLRAAVLFDRENVGAFSVAGDLVVNNANVYKRVGSGRVTVQSTGSIDVNNGYLSVNAMTVSSDGVVDVSKTGLIGRPGPRRIALVAP